MDNLTWVFGIAGVASTGLFVFLEVTGVLKKRWLQGSIGILSVVLYAIAFWIYAPRWYPAILVGSLIATIFVLRVVSERVKKVIEVIQWHWPITFSQTRTESYVPKPKSAMSWLEQELSSDLQRISQGMRGRFTQWNFSNIYNREPYFEILNELTNTTLFTFSLKGISGLMKIEGQQCSQPQVSTHHGITRREPVTIRVIQHISAETSKLIQDYGNAGKEIDFDLRDMVFEFENTTKGYGEHTPRLVGGQHKVVPKDGLK